MIRVQYWYSVRAFPTSLVKDYWPLAPLDATRTSYEYALQAASLKHTRSIHLFLAKRGPIIFFLSGNVKRLNNREKHPPTVNKHTASRTFQYPNDIHTLPILPTYCTNYGTACTRT